MPPPHHQSADTTALRIPNDNRLIIHIDYDCFYASVIENLHPHLRQHPLGIQQKTILATCNYLARARGVGKLMLVSEAKRRCPELVIVNGEDLTRFRDASKRIWLYVRSVVWEAKVERLGFDELFLDVTEMIDYNLNEVMLAESPTNPQTPSSILQEPSQSGLPKFFHLSRTDPTYGFPIPLDIEYVLPIDTYTYPPLSNNSNQNSTTSSNNDTPLTTHLPLRLLLATHLAAYLRNQIYTLFNHTSSGGISTNKLLAKLVGNVNKPNKQTVLVPEGAQVFMDGVELRKVPGVGRGVVEKIREGFGGGKVGGDNWEEQEEWKVTVRDVRMKLGDDIAGLARLLSGDGKRGVGMGKVDPNTMTTASKLWKWVHGMDDAQVNPTSLVPTQISIEDTYRGLRTGSASLSKEIVTAVVALVGKLVRRMRVDLLVDRDEGDGAGSADPTTATMTSHDSSMLPNTANITITTNPNATPTPIKRNRQKWLAYPRTFRVSIRVRERDGGFGKRVSRSTGVPGWVFGDVLGGVGEEVVAEKVVREVVGGCLRRLVMSVGGGGEVDVQLLNVAVTNMVEKGISGGGGGCDVGKLLFRHGVERGKSGFSGSGGHNNAHTQPAEGNDIDGDDDEQTWMEQVREIERVYAQKQRLEQASLGSPSMTSEFSHVYNEHGSDDDEDEDEDNIHKHDEADDFPPPSTDYNQSTRHNILEPPSQAGAFAAITCRVCGTTIPQFMVDAHARFHEFEG